jgi:hypothetical protein
MKIDYSPLYTTENLVTLKGRAKAGVAISPGTVIGVTANGEVAPYNKSATDGSNVARGIALCEVSADDEDRTVIYAIMGVVIESKCKLLDADAKSALTTIYFVKDTQM